MKADDIKPRFVLDGQAAGELKYRLKQDPQAGLKEAARQFEGMLLNMVLKSMRDATPQDGLLNSDQTRFFSSLHDQQLAQNLAGRLGFAKLIEQQLGGKSGTVGAASGVESVVASSLERQLHAAQMQALSGGAGRWRSSAAPPATVGETQAAGAPVPAGASEFVNRVWPRAVDAARSLGVPPHFLVAHAALETGWGKSEIRVGNGTPSHNLFGIKAGKGWGGAAVEAQTTEYVNGEAQSVRERFRVYGSYGDAFRDYAGLLRGNPRYAGVLGQQDGTQFARSLQQGGYATDPQYADKLGRIINGMTLRQALAE